MARWFWLLLFLAAPSFAAGHCQVLLVPGAFGVGSSTVFLDARAYFADYEKFFQDQGCRTRRVEFPQDVTIEARGRILRDQIERMVRESDGRNVLVVAHSQGGLDARYALKTLGVRGVSALITIGTPHHGTPLADWVIAHRSRGSLLYWVLRLFGNYDLRQLPFVGEMTESFLRQHSENFAAVSGVRYASARASCQSGCHWPLRLLSWLSAEPGFGSAGGGDGLVPEQSQSFGEDLGVYDLDHISEVSEEIYKYPERKRFLNSILPYIR